MWEIIKRKGTSIETLRGAPTFMRKDDAEAWVKAFKKNSPDLLQRETIEIRKEPEPKR